MPTPWPKPRPSITTTATSPPAAAGSRSTVRPAAPAREDSACHRTRPSCQPGPGPQPMPARSARMARIGPVAAHRRSEVADPYWCMTAPRLRGPMLLAAGAALLGVLLTACTGSRFRYIRHESTKTYFKVPEAWRLFNEDEILKAQAAQLTA